MSSLSYRSWDIWINTEFSNSQQAYDGYFECIINNGLMVPQTIEFLHDKFNICNRNFNPIQSSNEENPRHTITNEAGQLYIRLYENFVFSSDLNKTITEIRDFINSISLAVDAPLICHKIQFISADYGPLLVAARRPIARGGAFEIEERGRANKKILEDIPFYQESNNFVLSIGSKYYLTGLQLLTLEDQMAGLIDAAFMQFYQGCEVLCRDPTGRMEESKKKIATMKINDADALQIIAHQVWRVRNTYFGHGDINFNFKTNISKDATEAVAKQVLVARYLCRRLIDVDTPSKEYLAREMGIFFDSYSGDFTGDIEQLNTNFRVEFKSRDCKVYNSSGKNTKTHTIK